MTAIDTSDVIAAIEDKDIVLVTAPSNLIEQVNTDLIHHINEKEGMAIYVTVAKPYNTVTNVLEEEGIDTDEMFFIDCITKTTANAPPRAENCVFLQPQALKDISIALSEAVESMPDDRNRYLVLDTLSTLMLYNEERTVGKFAHSLVNKIREWGIKSVMLTLEDEASDEITSQIRQFCDKSIHVGPEPEE